MSYGHAERNLALIRQLEAETRQLLDHLPRLDAEQSTWLQQTDDGIIPDLAIIPGMKPGRMGRPAQ